MRIGLLFFILVFLCLPFIEAEIVIVMPFDNHSLSVGEQWLSRGIAILITEELAANGIKAISWEVWQQYKENLAIPAKVPLSRASSIKIAVDLGADFLILGNYQLNQANIKLTAKVIDLQKGQYICKIIHSSDIQQLSSLIITLSSDLISYLPEKEILTAARQNIPKEAPAFEALRALVIGLEERDPNKRIDYFMQALETYPGYLRANWELAKVYFQQGDYPNSEAICVKLVQQPGFDVKANFLLSLICYYQSRFEESINILEGLVNTLPVGQVLNNLGLNFIQIGDFEKALWYLEKAQALQPDEIDYLFNLGYLYWKRKNFNKSIEWLKKVVMKDPSFYQAHWLLSSSLKELGREEEANEEYLLARGYAPGSLVVARMEKGNYPLEKVKVDIDIIQGFNGLRIYKQDNAKLKVELAEFYMEQGELMFNRGEVERALRELKKSVYLFPYSHETHLLLAKIYTLQDKTAQAINELKMSIWSKENYIAHLELAKIYFKLEQKEEALAQLEECLSLQPDNQEAMKLKKELLSMKEE